MTDEQPATSTTHVWTDIGWTAIIRSYLGSRGEVYKVAVDLFFVEAVHDQPMYSTEDDDWTSDLGQAEVSADLMFMWDGETFIDTGLLQITGGRFPGFPEALLRCHGEALKLHTAENVAAYWASSQEQP
jgi:hypothetical protein